MRKPQPATKGKPRGKPFVKKEAIPVEQTQPAEQEPVDIEGLQAAVQAAFAKREGPLPAAAPEPVTLSPREQDDLIRETTPELQKPPVAAPVAVVEEATLDAILGEQKAASAPAGAAQYPPRKRGETKQQYMERLAEGMILAERRRRDAYLEARRLGKPVGPLPAYAIHVPTRPDGATIPEGARTKEGWWQTWVPKTSSAGIADGSLGMIQDLRRWDYEVVTDADGKPVQGRLGVLMQGPPERRAARIASMTPVGARRHKSDPEEQYQAVVEGINREHGRRVLTVRNEAGDR
jgi:hypothetical protein